MLKSSTLICSPVSFFEAEVSLKEESKIKLSIFQRNYPDNPESPEGI